MSGRGGLFITFEGGEGSGKTTQIALLSKALEQAGLPLIRTREPGGTPLAEKIRPLLVEAQQMEEEWSHLSETLLFFAARAQHWQYRIQPALCRGEWVLCDRFMDSTFVYQGIARGVGLEKVREMHRNVLGDDITPDITFLLDLDVEVGLKRAVSRQDNETRFESLEIDFHRRLREGFHKLASEEAERFVCIDATQPVDVMHNHIFEVIRQRASL